MKYRHELKMEINYIDSLILQARLGVLMEKDASFTQDKCEIRSIIFDSKKDKFRIRYFNNDTSYIVLEKKSRIDGLTSSVSCVLSKEEAEKIINCDIEWMKDSDRVICNELYKEMKDESVRPKTIVDYTRVPFVYTAGNVHITIDYNIRTCDFNLDYLNQEATMLPLIEEPIILEIKWEDCLPDVIKDAVTIPARRVS